MPGGPICHRLVANDGRTIPPAKLAGLLARNAGARGGARLRAATGRSGDCYTAFAPRNADGHQKHEH
eukprot:8388457-Lingulodinium_polyedra.AAC.1